MDKERQAKDLANVLHSKFCRHNHTDVCGWMYEYLERVPQWDKYTHKRYLERAEKLIDKWISLGLNIDDAILAVKEL